MTDIVSHDLIINAPPSVIFDLMTSAEGLLQWIAIDANVEACTGGTISWTHANGRTIDGEFVEIQRPNRIVFTYGWRGHQLIGAGTTVVEVTLTPADADTTHLRLVHRQLPDNERESHALGWRHFIAMLASTSESTAKNAQRN